MKKAKETVFENYKITNKNSYKIKKPGLSIF